MLTRAHYLDRDEQMNAPITVVPFDLDELHFGLHARAVERIVPAMEVEELPGAPAIILGIINLRGNIVPVLSLRKRFGLPERDFAITDQFILATIFASAQSQATSRRVALAVDSVRVVVELPAGSFVPALSVVPGLEYIEGVARMPDGLLLIQDLDRCLSFSESNLLDTALEAVDG